MFRSTAARLTILYTVLFGLLAAGMVAYISTNTSRLLLGQFRTAIEEEVTNLARMSRRGGLSRLVGLIENRARQPGANLYLIVDRAGRILAGNVAEIDRSLLAKDGWRTQPFAYVPRGSDTVERRAVARVFTLPQGLRLLVGRDTADAERFSHIVFQAMAVALSIMVGIGILLWFFIGRRGLLRMKRVVKASDRISAGDLSQRLPLSGAGDEFDDLARSLNTLIARIEKLNTGVTRMSDAIAHDLRTPLTRLRNMVEEGAGDRDAIVQQADTMIATFDALLTISRMEAGASPAAFERVEVAGMLADVHELYEPMAEEAGVRLTVVSEPELFVSGNRSLLVQAVVNLLDNALKYGAREHDANIEIEGSAMAKECAIIVRDNGTGITEQDRERALDRMVRLDASRSQPGSGLGLSLVRAIARQHGGSVALSDAEPGLQVTITLPRAA